MKRRLVVSSVMMAGWIAMPLGASAVAAGAVQIGASGKTYASATVACGRDANGNAAPAVQAGLVSPKRATSATVLLNGNPVATVTAAYPAADVWLVDGAVNTVSVVLSKKSSDDFQFAVPAGLCAPDTSGNTFSADGTLEYAASGKSYATVAAGCALNGATGLAQPFVNLFDNGGYLLNVSVNGVPLTQLSSIRPHTPVFLSAGLNVISAANGSLSIDYYVRDGGDGTCALP